MNTKMRFFFILLFISALYCNGEGSESFTLYTDIKPANLTESAEKIKQVPIVYYKFKYDSVVGRNQMGVLGPEAQKYFPESIDVVSSRSFVSKEKSKPTILTNFPMVDKNVLFMHGLAAAQYLIEKYENLLTKTQDFDEIETKIQEQYQSFEDLFRTQLEKYENDKSELLNLESSLESKETELSSAEMELEHHLAGRELEKEKTLLDYQEQLANERLLKQEELTRENMIEILKLERELAERREELQRETAQGLQNFKQQQEAEFVNKKIELEKEKIKAEIDAKAEQARMDEKLAIERIKMQSQLDTDRMIAGIRSISNQISVIVADVLSKPEQIGIIAGIIIGLFAFYYLVKELSSLLRQFIQSRLGRPSLVRETSVKWSIFPTFILNLFAGSEKVSVSLKRLEQQFHDIILSSEDKRRVLSLALATRNTRNSGAPYRHVLLHGPPGTGKTLIARRLAKCSDMDCAIMSGGDVTPLGDDAVNQLHSLFRWAERSKKGLLLFIDEAEAFLSTRTGNTGDGSSDGGSGTHIRNALNALLYQTGTPSRNFMMVLATNRPEDLDPAVLDRIDVSLPIGLPEPPQRLQLIQLYMEKHVNEVALKSQNRGFFLTRWFFSHNVKNVEAGCVSSSTLQRIAQETEGFSGREIAKLFIAVQYAMYLAENQTITLSLLRQTVKTKVDEHILKLRGFSVINSSDVNINLQERVVSNPNSPKRGN